MGRSNKKHHYIPQCYLRNFSYNGTKLHTYDKVSSKIYAQNISDTCQIVDFYKLSDRYIQDNPDAKGQELVIECDYFANYIEPSYVKTINEIINVKNRCVKEHKSGLIGISINDKKAIAKHIAIQFLRLPFMRDNAINTFNEIMPKMVDLLKESLAKENNDPDYLKLNITAHCDPAIEHAKTTFLNEEFVVGTIRSRSFISDKQRYCLSYLG